MGKQAKQRQARKRGRDAPLLDALDLLSRRRAPYADLTASMVRDTIAAFPLGAGDPGRPVVEIGAGTGQLRAWLAPATAARTIHTDPSARALARLRGPVAKGGRDREGDAASAGADGDGGGGGVARAVALAQALPFRDGTCDGVLGLCVFDAIHAVGAEAAAVAECARVLAPGGRFVHVLDMATLLDVPFTKLVAGGLVPIPNVFSDPGDHEWPLDVLLLQREWLSGLLDLATRARHALPVEFGALFAEFGAAPGRLGTAASGPPAFDATVATQRWKAVASDGQRRFALSSLIASACRLAVQQGYPSLQPSPFHSARYLASLVEATFRDSGAFRVDLSRVVHRHVWRPATPDAGQTPRYRSLALGHERTSSDLPARLLDESARADQPPADGSAPARLTEAGAHIFVATRL